MPPGQFDYEVYYDDCSEALGFWMVWLDNWELTMDRTTNQENLWDKQLLLNPSCAINESYICVGQ